MLNLNRPYWEMPDFPLETSYFGDPKKENTTKVMVITGPSRNGNHLVHSFLDNHPALPRIPGEDRFLNSLFEKLNRNCEEWDHILRSDKVVDTIIGMSGGDDNKWFLHHEGCKRNRELRNKVYSGVFSGRGESNFVYDYEDTVFPIDYDSFRSFLIETTKNGVPETLYDLLILYFKALGRLDPDYHKTKAKYTYDALTFRSGSSDLAQQKWTPDYAAI